MFKCVKKLILCPHLPLENRVHLAVVVSCYDLSSFLIKYMNRVIILVKDFVQYLIQLKWLINFIFINYISEEFLKLENLIKNISRPCILDIKMGRRTYDPEASPEKVALEIAKFPPVMQLGYQFSGMLVSIILKNYKLPCLFIEAINHSRCFFVYSILVILWYLIVHPQFVCTVCLVVQ